MTAQTAVVLQPAHGMVASDMDKDSIQSIDRAAQVLALFDQDTVTLSPALVSDRLGLNRTTAHRYLLSLQSTGFLTPANAPGPLLDQLATFLSGRRRVLTLAPRIMRQLSDETGVTAVLTLLGQSGPVVSLVEESAVGTIVLTVRVGTVLELWTAQGRVLLAYQTDQEVIDRHYSPLPEPERARELAQLARVRRERIGWADLGHLGLAAVAAPVFGGGDIQAAIALLGTDKMLPTSERSDGVVKALREAAAELSRLVGA
ncbi:MAG TPA: helix-turn-helix domain-containing protein [Gryllotalpicola sp.]